MREDDALLSTGQIRPVEGRILNGAGARGATTPTEETQEAAKTLLAAGRVDKYWAARAWP